MMSRHARWLLVLSLTALLQVSPACAQFGDDRPPDPVCEDLSAFWPLWRALAGQQAGLGESEGHLFPLAEVLASLRGVPLTKPLPASFAEATEYYRPSGWYNEPRIWPQTATYAKAASAYETGDLREAIRQFDAMVGDRKLEPGHLRIPGEPFRAAAAYTAARAAFRLGDFEDGAIRVDRILSDWEMSEFWVAAWKLIPRIRYGTDAAPLAAAELAAISHLLRVRSDVLCHLGTIWSVDENIGKVRSVDIGRAIAEAAAEDYGLAWFGSDFLRPGLDYAQSDPVIAALSRMPAFPTLGLSSGFSPWLRHLRGPLEWSPSWRTVATASDVVSAARESWRTTHNPLWALELGQIGSEQDLPALVEAIAVVRGWSADLSGRAKATLIWALTAHRARLFVISGKRAEALAALGEPTADERQLVAGRPPELARAALESVVSSGTRYFLARGDVAAARQWAIDSSTAVHWPVPEVLKPLLVSDLAELYRHPILGLMPVDGLVRLGPWRQLLDGWSSARLIEFSRRYDVAPEDRRAMVGAAWIRAMALRHWSDVFGWLPDLRSAFPSLTPDIALIEAAWLPATKRHLATRLALLAPGLVAFPSWSRPPGDVTQMEVLNDVHRPADVLAFDPYHPSDGNWWCSPRPAAILEDDRQDLYELLNEGRAEGQSTLELLGKVPLLQAADDRELASLAAAGSATRRLAEDAIAWAQHREWLSGWFGSDEYLPETLHLAVRATRFGCRRPADNSPWSRAAFKLLHERFPMSGWTQKTPYWFGVIGQN